MAESWRFKFLAVIIQTIVIFFIPSRINTATVTVTAPESKPRSLEHDNSLSKSSEKPKLQIYYEVLCPWSRNYIVQEFIPAMIKFKKYVDYELIPFGHANITTITESGVANATTAFKCPHGESECEGNMLHACAIANQLGDLTIRAQAVQNASFNHDDYLLGFLGCTLQGELLDSNSNETDPKRNITYRNFRSMGEKCAKMFDLDWDQIRTCWKGEQGINLLKSMGEKTKELPILKSVPHVRFNGSLTDETNWRHKLENFLCSQIQPKFLEKLAVCENISN